MSLQPSAHKALPASEFVAGVIYFRCGCKGVEIDRPGQKHIEVSPCKRPVIRTYDRCERCDHTLECHEAFEIAKVRVRALNLDLLTHDLFKPRIIRNWWPYLVAGLVIIIFGLVVAVGRLWAFHGLG